MSVQIVITENELSERFPEAVSVDERKGYSGYLVKAENLIEVATYLRDEMGYDYLSSVTATDYITDDMMEVVYHAFQSTGGSALVFKVQVPRGEATVPSLVPVYPGADLQERETWDLLGVKFEGHPDLRRVLLWEGFDGHPLRKDWREAYFEEEGKPYKTRWPDGQVYRAEEKNPFGSNVDYPAGFDPETWVPDQDSMLYESLRASGTEFDSEISSDQLVVNMGPQHPSTHGVFRIVVRLEGEMIRSLKPVMGYLHRNHEKIAERNTFLQNIPFTDRLDYLSSMSNNFGYVLAVEKLMGVKPPERAEYLPRDHGGADENQQPCVRHRHVP